MTRPDRLAARCVLALCTAAWTFGAAAPVRAAEVVRVLVATPPGSAPDLMARLLAEHMGRGLGQATIVENRPGASGTVATEAMIAAPADGSTLYVAGFDHIVYGPAALGRKPWDPFTDLTPVGPVNQDRWMIAANPAAGGDLDALARTGRSRELRCANGGEGTTQHAICAWFARRTGLAVQHVPYARGFMADLIGGTVDLVAAPAPTLVQAVKAGQLRGILLLSTSRHPAVPDVPTATEAGRPELVFEAGIALFTSRGVPAARLEQLQAALLAAQSDPAIRDRFAELGVDTVPMQPGQAQPMLRRRLARAEQIRVEAFGKAP
jgi:tripartite-type tricarboxylate transporter receptor subunit TctC